MEATISALNGASSTTFVKPAFFDKVDNLCKADGGDDNGMTGNRCILDEPKGRSGEFGVLQYVSKNRMCIGNAGNHSKSSAKPRNISRRFSSISSAEGPGPY